MQLHEQGSQSNPFVDLGYISCFVGLFFFLVLVTATLFMTSIFSVPSPIQAEALLKTCKPRDSNPSLPCCPMDTLCPQLWSGLGMLTPPATELLFRDFPSPSPRAFFLCSHACFPGIPTFLFHHSSLSWLTLLLQRNTPFHSILANAARERSVLRPHMCSQRAITCEGRIKSV